MKMLPIINSLSCYIPRSPCILLQVIDVKDNIINMYLNMFLPELERQTMAIIGCVQGFGAITPAAEMQCRAACRVFKVMWKHYLFL